MQILGTIITTEETPSTTEFSFVISGKDSTVKKGQFIQTITKSNENMFGYVHEIFRANRYFERAESVAEYERIADMEKNFPIDSWEHMIANVRVLGNYKDGKFARTFVPPSPGAKVLDADQDVLKKFLGFEDNGMLVGNIQHHDTPARINMTRLLQKHLAILAMSGAGKSHLASVLLEELLDRKQEDGRIATIVIDIHGEYVGFQYDEKYGKNVQVIEGGEIRIPLRKINPEIFEEWLPNLSGPQRELLRQSLHDLRVTADKKEGYGLKELFAQIEKNEGTRDETKKTLIRALGEMKRYKFISKNKELPKLRQVEPGKLVIFDFSSIDSLRKKQMIVAYVGRRLFSLRKKLEIPPFLLLIEEAHNFAREKAEAQDSISRSIIETIAREGRKFGASLCLVSQRPVNLSTTALSQCNTHIILRVTNPNDLMHIEMSSEGIDSRISKSIAGLKTGEGIVVGEAVNYPVFVNIRQRKSVKREKGLPLHEQARQFEETRKKKEEQVEAFL